MALAVGQLLQNRYRILRLLGQGGMGAVYLAEDTRLGRQCAIKENIPDPHANPQVLAQLRQQFQVEARILATLDHPNLPKVHDFFTDGDNEYIVLEYVEGDTLATLSQRQGGPLPERPVLLWADQVLDALEELHGQQPQPIIHRDIKPANIILTARGRIKLVDFGLVKLLDPGNPGTATAMKGMGTAEYAPLEQYGKGMGHTDARSDIYSLGATLYHLLTGVAPPEVTQRILDPTKLAPPRQRNPALSPATEAAVLRAMEIHPDQRWQAASAFRHALQMARPTVITAGATVAQPPPPPAGAAPILPAQGPIAFDWVTIPAGEFLMGSDPKKDRHARSDEQPQHPVYLAEYLIARVPVTNAQYKVFVDATGHRAPGHWGAGQISKGQADHPVARVSWDDAQAFCRWAGVRLPSEAEWEKAARGADGRIYPWGDERPDRNRCNFDKNEGGTTPVEQYTRGASPYGVLDMSGNVWEWVTDWYDKNYYAYSLQQNPTGPVSGRSRMMRGGSWFCNRVLVRAAVRDRDVSGYRHDFFGFRCARTP